MTHQLDSVVVTASGFEQQIKEAPASISVITREELETKPFHNLADAVADVEGVTVERGGKAGGMNISIRGLPSDYAGAGRRQAAEPEQLRRASQRLW